MELSNEPAQLSDVEKREVVDKMATCPFVGAIVATSALPVLNSAARPLARIDDLVAIGNTGGGDLGTKVLHLFASGNHRRQLDGTDALVPSGLFNLQFGGSQGAHPGHSGILLGDPHQIGAGRLDREQFDRLAAHADEHGLLSIDAVGDFIAENVRRDPQAQVLPGRKVFKDLIRLLGEVKDLATSQSDEEKTEVLAAVTKLLSEDHLMASAGEWGLLFALLRQSQNSRNGRIALSDVRMMFIDKALPAGWDQWKKETSDWMLATVRLGLDAWAAYHIGVK